MHFDPDARKNAQGQYSLPPRSPYPDAKPGGIGTGTSWFALDKSGRGLQVRIGPEEPYADVVVGAGRLQSAISLDTEILDDRGDLVVEIFDNTPSEFGGDSFGHAPVDLTGKGGIRLADGRLILNGRSDFTGGVTVESGGSSPTRQAPLGTGDVDVRGGALTLRRAALGDAATLRLADKLQDGAIRLDFSVLTWSARSGLETLCAAAGPGEPRLGRNVHRCRVLWRWCAAAHGRTHRSLQAGRIEGMPHSKVVARATS